MLKTKGKEKVFKEMQEIKSLCPEEWTAAAGMGVRKIPFFLQCIVLLVLIFSGMSTMVDAAIFYDSKRDVIHIKDFPESMPCTLSRLAKVARLFEGEKVTYDESTNTYTVNCNLIIGDNDGTDTVLQVGTPDRPDETLIMKGNLYIAPYFIKAENEGKYWRARKYINAVVLGDRDAPKINAALKFASTPEKKYTIYVGRLPWREGRQWGGGIYVYNSVITAHTQKPDYKIGDEERGDIFFHGSVVLVNAELSWVENAVRGMSAGKSNLDYEIKDTVFDHVGVPLLSGAQKVTGSTFKNCGAAVRDRGSIDATLVDCVFKNNQRNWTLKYTRHGIVSIDSTYDKPQKGNLYQARTTSHIKEKRYPAFTSKRHIIVEVVDSEGKPVPEADVIANPEEEDEHVSWVGRVSTGEDGKTPGKNSEKALLLTEVVKQITDTLNQPDVTKYTYIIEASADSKGRGRVKGIQPTESWKEIHIQLNAQ